MFLLDTNTVSMLFRAPPPVLRRHVEQAPMTSLFISSLVEAELRYGIEKKKLEKSKLASLVDSFLANVTILPWTSSTAKYFARLRAASEATGITVSTIDLMIATHAKQHSMTLVTHDQAMLRLSPWLHVVDWANDAGSEGV